MRFSSASPERDTLDRRDVKEASMHFPIRILSDIKMREEILPIQLIVNHHREIPIFTGILFKILY